MIARLAADLEEHGKAVAALAQTRVPHSPRYRVGVWRRLRQLLRRPIGGEEELAQKA
jgi:hypothetical protein